MAKGQPLALKCEIGAIHTSDTNAVQRVDMNRGGGPSGPG